MAKITTEQELRAMYTRPSERAVKKALSALDKHCRRFVELASFVVISSVDATGRMDSSPRGGEPGFVLVLNDKTLLLPDWPGNNRLDTCVNIIETGRIGLMFLVPGVDEILRVNGQVELRNDPNLVELFTMRGNHPKLVFQVTVSEAFLHCAKAIMRAGLWPKDRQIPRNELPSMGQMLSDQIGQSMPGESQQDMVERYNKVLY